MSIFLNFCILLSFFVISNSTKPTQFHFPLLSGNVDPFVSGDVDPFVTGDVDTAPKNRSRNRSFHHVIIEEELRPQIQDTFTNDDTRVLEPLIANETIEVINDLINSTRDGLIRGHSPVRTSEGTGGSYFMPRAAGGEYVSVFKPIDEEPKAENNPRGGDLSVDGEGLKKGTRVGGGAFRECAAYILDHPKSGRRSVSREGMGFSGVPPTVLVRCFHGGFNHPDRIKSKIGSLQKFMKSMGNCEDNGPGNVPVEEVHKIAIIDLRMANADRHGGNILRSKGEDGEIVLIPIDHGYCLPESFEDVTFEWAYWKQACKPFCSETIEYINSLDAEEDITLLKASGWSVTLKTARTLRVSTMLLKKGTQRGLPPSAIAQIMCRPTQAEESVIEKILLEASHSILPTSSEEEFLAIVSTIMDRHLMRD